MKRFFIPILIIIFSACSSKSPISYKKEIAKSSSIIHIIVDTLHLPIYGDLVKVVWFRNSFYGIFETARRNTTELFRKMIAFNPKGGVMEDVFLPKEIQEMTYVDLKVFRDSLFIKDSEFERTNWVLGEYIADFSPSKTRKLPLFEDDQYKIFSECYGEFGATLYFQEQKTGMRYEVGVTCPLVINKIDSEYYVTSSYSLIKIQNPKKLARSPLHFKKRIGSAFTQGIETIFFLPTPFGGDSPLITSLEIDQKLLTVYTDQQKTYLGKIAKNTLNPIYTFPFRFDAYGIEKLGKDQQVATCLFEGNKKGILMIQGKNFHFYRL